MPGELIRTHGSKTQKIFLDSGSFLGRGEGCLIVSDRKRNVTKHPLFENQTSEIQAEIGSMVSVGALATAGFWGIDFLVTTQRGNPVAYLKSIEDDSHVQTRIAQYESFKDGRAIEIAKKIVLGKAQGQNEVLRKYSLRQHDVPKIKGSIDAVESTNLKLVRKKLLNIEGRFTDFYFRQIFPMLPKTY